MLFGRWADPARTSTPPQRSDTVAAPDPSQRFDDHGATTSRPMSDVDLLRRLMLMLEERELSPRQNVIIELFEESLQLECSAEEVADGLDRLLGLDYIDGAGWDEEGFFLFRKLTRRGSFFLDEVRHPRDWARIKKHYAGA